MDDYQEARRLIGVGQWRSASGCLTNVLAWAEDFLTSSEEETLPGMASDDPELLHVLITLSGAALEWNRLCQPGKANRCYTVLLKLFALTSGHDFADSQGHTQSGLAQTFPAMVETRIWIADENFATSQDDLLMIYFQDICAGIESMVFSTPSDPFVQPMLQLGRACLDLAEFKLEVVSKDSVLSVVDVFWKVADIHGNYEATLLQAECLTKLARAENEHKDLTSMDFDGVSDGWNKCMSVGMPAESSDYILEYFKMYVDICRKLGKTQQGEKAAEDILSVYERSWCHCGQWLASQVAAAFFSAASNAYMEYEDTIAKKHYERSASLYHQAADEKGRVPLQAGQCYLRVGLIDYRASEYQTASEWLLKALSVYEKALKFPREPGAQDPLNQVALVTAWIASSYSHLRSLKETIKYCKRTLQLSRYLDEVIVHDVTGNLGETYHQMGAIFETEGQLTEAADSYDEAEKAFKSLLDGCRTPFLFLTYGYFLLRRKRHDEAQATLMQAFLNFPNDPFCSSFREEERPILIPDMLFEVEHAEKHEVMIPADICIIYLRTVSLLEGHGNQLAVENSLAQLEELVQYADYTEYQEYAPDYTSEQLHAFSLSCLGYVYRLLGRHDKALDAFRTASEVDKDSSAASINMEREQEFLSLLGEDSDH